MYSAFLSKIRNIPGLLDPLKELSRLHWDDPKKTYEALREECDFLIEEIRQEKQSKHSVLYVRDGKLCPNGKSCAYSHHEDIIEKAKKAKEAYQAGKGDKGKGKGKDKGKKGKGKGKGKVCPFFNDKGCNYGSACETLPWLPKLIRRRPINLAPKAKAAAAPKAAAADPSKP